MRFNIFQSYDQKFPSNVPVGAWTRNGTWEHGSCMLLAAAVEVQACAAICCHSILTSVHFWQSLAFPTWECTWNQLTCACSLWVHCHTLQSSFSLGQTCQNSSMIIYGIGISMVSSKHAENCDCSEKIRKIPCGSCDFQKRSKQQCWVQ